MAEATLLKRVFTVGNIEIADPNPDFTLEEVRKFLAGQYPEITNANISGPELKDDKAIYSFNANVGTKG